jgi:ubiquinone/menaquinone biosynthesis C-methylase UbiE
MPGAVQVCTPARPQSMARARRRTSPGWRAGEAPNVFKIYIIRKAQIMNPFKSNLYKKIISRQFRRPSGLLGLYALNFMKKNNQDYIEHVCGLLHPQDTDAILEIGCGAGYAIKSIAMRNHHCSIDAIDFSPMMLKLAKKQSRECANSDRIRFLSGDFRDFDFGDKTYLKIFAINVIYFWKDLFPAISKIHRLLKPDGRLILFMSSPERLNNVPFASDSVFTKYTLAEVKTALSKAGFSKITHEVMQKMGFDTFYICAEK